MAKACAFLCRQCRFIDGFDEYLHGHTHPVSPRGCHNNIKINWGSARGQWVSIKSIQNLDVMR